MLLPWRLGYRERVNGVTMKLVMKNALEVTRTFGLAKHDHEDEAENGENNGSLDDVLNSLENELNAVRLACP